MKKSRWSRREIIAAAAALTAAPAAGISEERKMHARQIPPTGEKLPVIGLGTYSVFDVESTPDQISTRQEIVDALLGEGGSVIDTSPMYRRSENIIGDVIDAGSPREAMFLATKVWTDGETSGVRQMRRSAELMSTDVIDLMQVHNLRDTAVHMKSIRNLQEQGRIRYNGLTHYTARAMRELEAQMIEFKPQFIQINYSMGEREAENRILPLAADMGIAVLINRPYQSGALFRAISGKELPEWAGEFATSWGQFFLKFIVSHPAVNCVIPATSKLRHMRDNLEAGFGRMPDQSTRRRMAEFVATL